jgi:putative SOS response-associated peptidase YedK
VCYSALVEQDVSRVIKNFDRDIEIHGFDVYQHLHEQFPQKYKEIARHERIYPYYFASVIAAGAKKTVCTPMRYQLWPSQYDKDPKHLSLFNARLDNLDSPIWRRLFMKQHGILTVRKFYEWVLVKDLVSAGKVTLDEIKAQFEIQAENRKKRIMEQGKKYSATKTEKIDAIFRKTIISFAAENHQDIYVPVLFDYHLVEDSQNMGSFAIITTEPTPEIMAAGHDRRPVFFTDIKDAWKFLNSRQEEKNDILELLNQTPCDRFKHSLDDVA